MIRKDEIIEAMCDNTAKPESLNKLGIFKFAKMFFPERFPNDFALLHYEVMSLLFMLLDPEKENLADRQAYFLVHRQAAKTTLATFLLPVFLIFMKGYSIFIRESILKWDRKESLEEWIDHYESIHGEKIIEIPINEDYIVVASETGSMAEDLVNELRTIIDTRADMAELFGEKKPKLVKTDHYGRESSKTWRKNTFITSDNTVLRGVGTGMQIRGRILGGKRPTLLIVDDMYSEENVITEQTRNKLHRWFFNAAVNSCDALKGKVLWLGTMIHPDTVVKTFKRSEFWFGIERPIISSLELRVMIDRCNEIKAFEDKDFFVSKRGKDILAEWNEECFTMSWKSRHNLRGIMMLYKQSMDDGTLNYFYQEYMCEYIAPETQMITPDTFKRVRLEFTVINGKQVVEYQEEETGTIWIGEVIVNVGIDPASSRSDNSDDTAILVAGFSRLYPKIPGRDWDSVLEEFKYGKIVPIIMHVEGGKYSVHIYEDMPGICERLAILDKNWKLSIAKIEAQGQQEQIVREVKRTFRDLKKSLRIQEEYTTMRKDERIRSIVYSIAHKYGGFLCADTISQKMIDKIYMQALTCGIGDHDDYVDALAIAFKNAREPDISLTGFETRNESNNSENRYDRAKRVLGKDAWAIL